MPQRTIRKNQWFSTPWSYKPSEGKKMDDTVISSQGEAQTIAQIVARYSQGIPLPTRIVEYVNGEDFEVAKVDNPETDLSEKFQEVASTLENLKKRTAPGQNASEQESDRSEAKESEQESESTAQGQTQKGSSEDPANS